MRLVDADLYCEKMCGYHGKCSQMQRKICTINKMDTAFDYYGTMDLLQECKDNARTTDDKLLIDQLMGIISKGVN